MKGKKADNDFVSNFIKECANSSITKIKDVIAAAEQQIKEIDDKIIEAEKLKKLRAKLKDVVEILAKHDRQD